MAGENFKPMPTDGWSKVCSKGTVAKVFLNATNSGVTDGTFQAVVLPSGIECKSVMIQIHNGTTTDFTSFKADPPGFHFSSTGHATNKDFTNHIGSHVVDIAKASGSTIGHVRAASGQYVVVEVIE